MFALRMRPIEVTCERCRERRADVDAGAGWYLASTIHNLISITVNENELCVLCFAILEEEQKGVWIARRHIGIYLHVCPFLHLHHLMFSSNPPPFRSSRFFTARTMFRPARIIIITAFVSMCV